MSHTIPAATGGFVYRAERSPQRLVAAQPGPGSYDVVRGGDVNPAPAPFHTSTERALAANPTTAAITPGPGAYSGLGSGIGTSGTVAGFVSGVPRLPADYELKAKKEVPGPGAYDDGNQWVKDTNRYKAEGGSAMARALQLLPRRSTAPSVPGRGESYGYEEAQDGTLVLQPAPLQHTGVGRDIAGPGTYELAGPGPFSRPSGTSWAASKSGRSTKFGSAAPGPGTYNLVESGPRRRGAGLLVTIGGVEVVFGGTTGTSSFVSKAPRPLQQAAEASPGPGEYHPPVVGAGDLAGAGLRASAAVFGSSAARGSWEMDPTQVRSAPSYWRTPGPGSYEDPRATGRRGSPNGASALAAAAAAAAAPFTTTALRFGSVDSAAPGPGQYHPDAVVSLEYDTFKRVTGSRHAGGFGGSTGRFQYQRGTSSPKRIGVPPVLGAGEGGEGLGDTPGPGAYATDAKLGGNGRSVGRGGTSTFASRTGRFRPVTAPPAVPDLTDFDGATAVKGDPSRLGPGAYSPERPTGRTRYTQVAVKAVPFGSGAKRAAMELPSNETPGPGRYGAAGDPQKPVSVPPPKAGFTTQSDRFGPAAPKYTPGPGAYLGPGSGPVRKSYNVTYGS
ncbi:hypothetical protein HXX76_009432 [Chlamydomonas incerta]|uniref:Uncharacterized protein n=1 Tax=Chlamydomonas incerta TaxID=51695 RepID=A0A835STX4_CHLIN|nr:hypothetical protein HXX76_009432 [Chlamydomonas incerta]|eukprot:KAG2431417.1 hypothetical protein HXX76_009432 [Chlamydomonas incerta]